VGGGGEVRLVARGRGGAGPRGGLGAAGGAGVGDLGVGVVVELGGLAAVFGSRWIGCCFHGFPVFQP
jgi:hypothetical protein